VLRGRFIALNAWISNEEKPKINSLVSAIRIQRKKSNLNLKQVEEQK
jgi:hypothetical protein